MKSVLVAVCCAGIASISQSQPVNEAVRREITVSGTTFLLDGQPFAYTGLSFFNAIYNPAFNKSSADRRQWLVKFQRYGINVLRVWAQWDNKRGFADAGPDSTLYVSDGTLRAPHMARLKGILADAGEMGFVIELCLFSHESEQDKVQLPFEAKQQAAAALALELKPWRHLTLQVWNEYSNHTLEILAAIKQADPQRLVTSSPGFSGVLGSDEENRALDYLTPHTSRQNKGRPWEIAPKEIASLLKKFHKPVVDDEPARNGTPQFGGPKVPTSPNDHILQIWQVWQLGGYITYHHDMFQTGYGSPAVPPSGVPDPEFNPYHRQALEFIAQRGRYLPAGRK